jgi:hypothetical protein
MVTRNIAEAATKMVDLLSPFETEERERVVHAALTLLGDAPIGSPRRPAPDELPTDIPRRAAAWLHQHGLNREQLDEIFHRDGDRSEVIAAAMPGHSNKERTLNGYLLTGVSRMLATGDASFDDNTARQLCRNLGCYDHTNHATYLKNRGNKFTGSKEQGWQLTAPGLAQAAALIRQMASN